MAQKHSVYSIFDLQHFAVESSEGNLRIIFTTDLHILSMPEIINVIAPYEITHVKTKPHGDFEKRIWDTDMPYMKYVELLCNVLDHLEQVGEEYYEEIVREQVSIAK